MFEVEFIFKNGKKVKLRELNVYAQDFIVSSIQQDDYFQKQEGTNRRIFLGSDDVLRTITVPFFTYDKYIHNFTLIRDELFGLFGKEEFWIREVRDEGYVSGKLYLVKLVDVIELKQTYKFSQHQLKFETTQFPYGISIKSTLDIQREGLTNDNSWAYGMGLETEDDSELKYIHTGKTFRIFNAGNVEVHPFESYLKIEIKNVAGSSNNFELVNRTNNSRFKITKQVSSSDVWIIEGPVVKRNSLLATKDTTKTFISLLPGWNTFEVLGASSVTASFDFKFLYK